MADPKPSLFRQPAAAPVATPATAAASAAKLDFIGIAAMKNGAVYFGQFTEDDSGVVTVKVPTSGGDVRTTRQIARAQIASTRALEVPLVRKLARIGPHVLSKSDVDRVAPAPAAAPTPATDATSAAAAEPAADTASEADSSAS